MNDWYVVAYTDYDDDEVSLEVVDANDKIEAYLKLLDLSTDHQFSSWREFVGFCNCDYTCTMNSIQIG